jgi:hypothetical protein
MRGYPISLDRKGVVDFNVKTGENFHVRCPDIYDQTDKKIVYSETHKRGE